MFQTPNLIGKFSTLLLVALLLSPISGCAERRAGPAERAGERLDEIGDNIREGKPPLHKKGAMEKMGESLDDATGANRR